MIIIIKQSLTDDVISFKVITSNNCVPDYENREVIVAKGEIQVTTDGDYFIVTPSKWQGGKGYKFVFVLCLVRIVLNSLFSELVGVPSQSVNYKR